MSKNLFLGHVIGHRCKGHPYAITRYRKQAKHHPAEDALRDCRTFHTIKWYVVIEKEYIY